MVGAIDDEETAWTEHAVGLGKGISVTGKTAVLACFQMVEDLIECHQIEAFRCKWLFMNAVLVEGDAAFRGGVRQLLPCHGEHAGINVHGVDAIDIGLRHLRIGASATDGIETPDVRARPPQKCQGAA